MWIHYERLHNHNKAKHNKNVCIFLGIYCTLCPSITINPEVLVLRSMEFLWKQIMYLFQAHSGSAFIKPDKLDPGSSWLYGFRQLYGFLSAASPVAHSSVLLKVFIVNSKAYMTLQTCNIVLYNHHIGIKSSGSGLAKRLQMSHLMSLYYQQTVFTQSEMAQSFTVYPKKYAHGFVVLCFVVVMQSFIMNSHEVFIHIHQGCFAGTGAIVRLPQCQWSKPDWYGKISQCITTTKHSKAKTVCIFLGIYCILLDAASSESIPSVTVLQKMKSFAHFLHTWIHY